VPAGRKPALVWFRNDLRLHDHEPLAAANGEATSVVPVYCFDPREYGKVGACEGLWGCGHCPRVWGWHPGDFVGYGAQVTGAACGADV
jgi:hypothetical protein